MRPFLLFAVFAIIISVQSTVAFAGPAETAGLTAMESQKQLETRYGKLSLTGDPKISKLMLGGKTLRDDDDSNLSFERKFVIGASDVVLMGYYQGGEMCPTEYFFVTVKGPDDVQLSPDFGTCNDLTEVSQAGDSISVSMSGRMGRFEPEEAQEKAAQELHVFTFTGGSVNEVVLGKPVQSQAASPAVTEPANGVPVDANNVIPKPAPPEPPPVAIRKPTDQGDADDWTGSLIVAAGIIIFICFLYFYSKKTNPLARPLSAARQAELLAAIEKEKTHNQTPPQPAEAAVVLPSLLPDAAEVARTLAELRNNTSVIPEKIRSELKTYTKTAQGLCLDCGYQGLVGVQGTKPLPWFLSGWMLAAVVFLPSLMSYVPDLLSQVIFQNDGVRGFFLVWGASILWGEYKWKKENVSMKCPVCKNTKIIRQTK